MTRQPEPPLFRIRTITAGVPLELATRDRQLQEAASFLEAARANFQGLGVEVESLRIATPPLPELVSDWLGSEGLRQLQEIDAFCRRREVLLSVGPVVDSDRFEPGLPGWASELIRSTRDISFSVSVASTRLGVHSKAVRSAAETIAAIAHASTGGEGNFRFAATALCPPGTPFFPAAWHRGEPSFALGLETPSVLLAAVRSMPDGEPASRHIAEVLNAALAPIEVRAKEIARDSGRGYLGIDASPAPGLDASIAEVIEALSGAPFGNASTLRACAEITEALKALELETCGYSGLMLPVLEDKVLARRAAEGRYGVSDLLLYSSVCGTGLDVVPLAGDTSVDTLASVIGDVAALSARHRKPLAARLLPVPGKKAGDGVVFENPFLTDSVVMGVS